MRQLSLLVAIAVFLVAKPSFSNTYSCYAYSDFGYDIGYDAGAQEEREGYSFDPDTVLNQPLYQIALKSIKQEAHITPYEESEFDWCFRKGFYDGYKAGYEGWEKRPTISDEKIFPVPKAGSIFNEKDTNTSKRNITQITTDELDKQGVLYTDDIFKDLENIFNIAKSKKILLTEIEMAGPLKQYKINGLISSPLDLNDFISALTKLPFVKEVSILDTHYSHYSEDFKEQTEFSVSIQTKNYFPGEGTIH